MEHNARMPDVKLLSKWKHYDTDVTFIMEYIGVGYNLYIPHGRG